MIYILHVFEYPLPNKANVINFSEIVTIASSGMAETKTRNLDGWRSLLDHFLISDEQNLILVSLPLEFLFFFVFVLGRVKNLLRSF